MGVDHTNTIWSMICLAWAHITDGGISRAEELLEDALMISTRVKGAEDPETQFILYCLAWAISDSGDNNRSIDLFKKALSKQSQLSGSTHPLTLSIGQGFARALLLANLNEYTITMLEFVVSTQKYVLGPKHPETIESIALLAFLYQREYTTAEKANQLYQEAFSSTARPNEAEHPAVAFLCNFALTHERLGQIPQSLAIFQKVSLSERYSILGHGYHQSTGLRIGQLGTRLDQRLQPVRRETGNNLFGRVGTVKCSACREGKVRVLLMTSWHKITIVSIRRSQMGLHSLFVLR